MRALSAERMKWLPGFECAGDLGELLRSWQDLPLLRESGDAWLCASQYGSELERQCAAGLSLAWGKDEGGQWLAGVRLLEFDSRLFGFGVAALAPLVAPACPSRPIKDGGNGGRAVVAACLDRAAAMGARQVSASVRPDDVASQQALAASGFHLADTLVGFHLDLRNWQSQDGDRHVRPATGDDVEAVAAISAECFGNRKYNVNRFNSDPVFPESKVRDLYALWARNSFSGQAADRVFVYEVDGRPVGFITCSRPAESALALGVPLGKIPLNAVHPDFQGRGVYTALVRAALSWLSENGATQAEIRTQLANTAVHRTWEKLGARLALACHRFHRTLAGPAAVD